MLKDFVWVGIGGLVGSVLRYAIQLGSTRWIHGFPFGTLTVNLVGCFAIGFFSAAIIKPSHSLYGLLVPGFCGGFTTFSTFSMDGYTLFKSGQPVLAVVYLSLSVLGSLAICLLGIWMGGKLSP